MRIMVYGIRSLFTLSRICCLLTLDGNISFILVAVEMSKGKISKRKNVEKKNVERKNVEREKYRKGKMSKTYILKR